MKDVFVCCKVLLQCVTVCLNSTVLQFVTVCHSVLLPQPLLFPSPGRWDRVLYVRVRVCVYLCLCLCLYLCLGPEGLWWRSEELQVEWTDRVGLKTD